ncbi:MAG: efflux RND transporter permease subunit [Gammaproteobacteria bacterium]|nr:efflux RND transporter permease subunit [Gammaproteobacteria bacterium]
MIKIIEFFIQKSAISIAMCLLILILGVLAGLHLEVRQSPRMDFPVIQITTEWPGASAQMVSDVITTQLQESLSGIEDINYMTSQSRAGESEIKLYFQSDYNEGYALAVINARISGIINNLPAEIRAPIIQKLSADNRPAMIIALTSQKLSRLEAADFLRKNIKPALEFIQGVSAADVLGESYALRIWLDPIQLQAHQLTANEVATIIHQKHFIPSLGIKRNMNTENLIQLNSALSLPSDFEKMILISNEYKSVALGDVARVQLGSADDDVTAYYNSKPTTMIFIHLKPGANPLTVSHHVQAMLERLAPTFPKDLHAHIVFDSSQYIYSALHEISGSIIFACLIITIVTMLSLGSMRLAFVPLTVIPLSLAGTCAFLWLMHCSINLLTLLAVVLAIGLVVDDAIIVIENIHRQMQLGITLYQAVLKGVCEIIGPVISMSFILTAVYLPIILSSGLSGKYFKEFALTLSISVMLSALIALFFSPWMSSQLLRRQHNQPESVITLCSDALFHWLHQCYANLLCHVWRYRYYLFCMLIVAIPMSVWAYHQLPTELAPREDQGFLQVMGHASYSGNTHLLENATKKLDLQYHLMPMIDRYIRVNNIPESHEFLSYVGFVPWQKRNKSIEELQKQLQQQLNNISDLQSTVILPSALPSDGGFPIEFVLKSSLDEKSLIQIAHTIQKDAKHSGLFRWIDVDTQFNHTDIKTILDRPLAAWLNIDLPEVARNIAWLLGQENFSWFIYHGQSYPIILHTQDEKIDMEQIPIRNRSGNILPLSSIAHFERLVVPNHYNQFQNMRSVTLSGVLSSGHFLGEALNWLNKDRERVAGKRVFADYAGESREYMSDKNNNASIFILSLLMIWLVLVVQFENFRTPITILLGSLPITIVSTLCILHVARTTLNIYTEVGLLTLSGLISKHGILMLDFARRLRKSQALSAFVAIQQAAVLRLRPILMTSLSMLFSAIPLVFAIGPGARSRFAIGLVIVSGIFCGTFFTLIFLPACYCVLERCKEV